jgi:hypothetical protein
MPGARTRFTVLTVAAGSELYDLAGLARIKAALKCIGIARTSLYKASGSDDWQIFIWWSESVKVGELEKLFADWLRAIGFSAANSLFVFPGSRALPLPLQPGFAWLDDRAVAKILRETLSLEQAVESFLNDMANGANDWETVSDLITNPTEANQDGLPVEPDLLDRSDQMFAIEVIDETVIEAREPLIDRVEQVAKLSAVRVIAVVQPTCDTKIWTQDICVPSQLWVRAPEVEYSVTFEPEQKASEEYIDDAMSDRNIPVQEHRRS